MALFLESTESSASSKPGRKTKRNAGRPPAIRETAKLRPDIRGGGERKSGGRPRRPPPRKWRPISSRSNSSSHRRTGQTVIVQTDDDWDGDTWWPWTGAYYTSDAYRGYVRDTIPGSLAELE